MEQKETLKRGSTGVKKEEESPVQAYLYKFRRCSALSTLERLKLKLEQELTSHELEAMRKAAAHRKVEIMSGKYFDEGAVSKELFGFASFSS